MRSWILATRESFWLLPAVFGIAAVVLAQGLVTIDGLLIAGHVSIPFFSELSASGGRSILTTIGTSMLTVAGTSFSITISVLATTSSTYGPRLVRNFMADRSNQFVLAMFTSTFLYCLVVLRSVRTSIENRSSFVPTISIHVAVLIAIVDAAVLVYFIHHIATSVQITTLQKRVQTDLVRAVDRTHPARRDAGWGRLQGVEPSPGAEVASPKDGYVQEVDLDDLLEAAVRHDVRISVRAMPGAHVIVGDPLADVSGPSIERGRAVDGRVAAAVRAAFAVGVARTPEQDLHFALQQLIEIAVRGLASGSNDPYTTVSALDLSRTALVPLLARPAAPNVRLDSRGDVRVVFAWPAAAALVADVLDSLRQYGLEHPSVVRAGFDLMERLGAAARSADVQALLATKADELLAAYRASFPDVPDLEAMGRRGEQVRNDLQARSRPG